jgi:DNA-binding MarR family transcriptional regulator
VITRSDRLEYVATELVPAAGLLTRLIARQVGVDGGLSRSEAGLLNTLTAGPRRITELAELEGLAQPTMTLLVKRLEEQGLVARERSDSDGRVVIVQITPAGSRRLEEFLGQVRAALRTSLAALPDAQIEALADAADALGELIATLQGNAGR